MKYPKIHIIVSLLLSGLLLFSCAVPSEVTDSHTTGGEPNPTTSVAAADDTETAAITTTTELTYSETTAADTTAVTPTEIDFSCYAKIETIKESGNSFLVTMTEDAFYSKGARLILRVTEDTVLMQEDGTALTYQDFQVGDPIGVVIEGMIQETDPAVPTCVTMIVKLNS